MYDYKYIYKIYYMFFLKSAETYVGILSSSFNDCSDMLIQIYSHMLFVAFQPPPFQTKIMADVFLYF